MMKRIRPLKDSAEDEADNAVNAPSLDRTKELARCTNSDRLLFYRILTSYSDWRNVRKTIIVGRGYFT